MLAVLRFGVPFDLLVPTGAEYRLSAYIDDGYTVLADIPARSDIPLASAQPEEIALNDAPAHMANLLSIKFSKDTFNRAVGSSIDPPEPVIGRAIRSLLGRLKYVAKAPQIRPIEFPHCAWRLQYLNDDGSELAETPGLIRGRGTLHFSFSYIACDPKLWDLVFSLPPDFEPPAWHTLLIDATGALPHVGTAVVLAATALEIFIAEVLNQLATLSPVPPPLWHWINDRGNWQKEPSVEEQYDVLLKVLCGHSLKEDNALWEALKNLRTARNSFVHAGASIVGRVECSSQEAAVLIGKASQVIATVRTWLPESLHWPEFEHNVKVQFAKQIVRAEPDRPESEGV